MRSIRTAAGELRREGAAVGRLRSILVPGCIVAVAASAALPALAHAEPPCPPGAAPGATIRARDLEDSGGPLTATHTIVLELDSADGPIDDFAVALPPGAEARRAGPGPALRVDAPGPVPVTATWRHTVIGYGLALPHGSTCTASAQTTLDLGPARPPRFSAPPPGAQLMMTELNWRLRVGENADLRPVEARLRGLRRARLPRASAPVQTISLGLRSGDKPIVFGTGRVLRSAGWRFRFGPYFRDELPIRMSKFEKSRRLGFGVELELVQGGRRIGRTRAVGRCEFAYGVRCRCRTMG